MRSGTKWPLFLKSAHIYIYIHKKEKRGDTDRETEIKRKTKRQINEIVGERRSIRLTQKETDKERPRETE